MMVFLKVFWPCSCCLLSACIWTAQNGRDFAMKLIMAPGQYEEKPTRQLVAKFARFQDARKLPKCNYPFSGVA